MLELQIIIKYTFGLFNLNVKQTIKQDLNIITLYFKMWNSSTAILYQFFPFAIYRNTDFIPPFPIAQTFCQASLPQVNLEKSQLSFETACRETIQINDEIPNRQIRNRKAKKQAKSRIIKRKDKEDNFEKKKQKKDRNLPSNICRFFVTFLYQHPNPQLILASSQTQISERINSCITQLKNHIKEGQTYVRPCLIEAICKGRLLGQAQSAIFRLLFKRFLKLEIKIVISLMKKLKKKQKVSYLKLAKRFLKYLTPQN